MFTYDSPTPQARRSPALATLTRAATAVVAAVVISACTNSSSSTDAAALVTEATAATNATVEMSGVKTYELPAPVHVETAVSYPQSPPVGGDHAPAWQNCGSYPDVVQNELGVHSLEHGAVWITYRPGLTDADIAVLRAFTVNQTHILVSPYPSLASPVVVTAWGHQLVLDDVNDPRLGEFIEAYQQGPQTPEPGAPCSGAIGEPE